MIFRKYMLTPKPDLLVPSSDVGGEPTPVKKCLLLVLHIRQGDIMGDDP